MKPFRERLSRFTQSPRMGNWKLFRFQGERHTGAVYVTVQRPLWLLAVVIAVAALLPSRVWFVMLAGMGLTIGLSLGWVIWMTHRVHFSRRLLHAWVQVGDRLEEIFTLRNDAPVPLLAIEIEDQSTVPGYTVSTVRSVDAGGQQTWRQSGISHRRGLFRLGPTVVRSSDPLGIFTVRWEYPDTREVLVFPPVLHDLAVFAPAGGGQGMAVSRQRSRVETAIIGGVRDYVPGDPIRRIHWPLSVRHRSFLVKEFDREMGGDIWLVLDMDRTVQVGEGDESTVEHGIIWASSWVWHLVRQGKNVGLYTYGPERIIIPPAGGSGQLWTILRALAPIETLAEVPLAAALREVKPLVAWGHSLIIITPSVSPDWPLELVSPGLSAISKVVVLLDASSFRAPLSMPGQTTEAEATAPVTGMHALLAGLGVTVRTVGRRESLGARPAAPGGGDWDYIVTPWGKVIVRSRPAEVEP